MIFMVLTPLVSLYAGPRDVTGVGQTLSKIRADLLCEMAAVRIFGVKYIRHALIELSF